MAQSNSAIPHYMQQNIRVYSVHSIQCDRYVNVHVYIIYISITASYIDPMESENVCVALFLRQELDIYL